MVAHDSHLGSAQSGRSRTPGKYADPVRVQQAAESWVDDHAPDQRVAGAVERYVPRVGVHASNAPSVRFTGNLVTGRLAQARERQHRPAGSCTPGWLAL